MAQIIESSDFESKVIKAEKPVLVDFFATWCGPCQAMAPVLENLSKDVADKASVFKVDIDKSPDLANKFNVMSVPTILIFKDGEVAKQFIGITAIETLKKELL
jgi:thioredoxin 1